MCNATMKMLFSAQLLQTWDENVFTQESKREREEKLLCCKQVCGHIFYPIYGENGTNVYSRWQYCVEIGYCKILFMETISAFMALLPYSQKNRQSQPFHQYMGWNEVNNKRNSWLLIMQLLHFTSFPFLFPLWAKFVFFRENLGRKSRRQKLKQPSTRTKYMCMDSTFHLPW